MPPRFAGVGLTKRFGPLVAVDGVSLTVAPGEIHCLLGENGAGKSTLSSCLYGLYRLDAGRMEVDGRPYAPRSPLDAVAAGLGMVHQHFVLVPTFTALENIVVGTGTGWRLDLAAARRRVSELCAGYGIALDLDRRVGELAVGERQWVEIIKALHLGARLLILDEPTAVLTPDESAHLFAILRQMTVAGLSVVLITHKMGEVMRTDRVSVLRKGRLVGTLRTAEASRDELARMMMGRTPSGAGSGPCCSARVVWCSACARSRSRPGAAAAFSAGSASRYARARSWGSPASPGTARARCSRRLPACAGRAGAKSGSTAHASTGSPHGGLPG